MLRLFIITDMCVIYAGVLADENICEFAYHERNRSIYLWKWLEKMTKFWFEHLIRIRREGIDYI